MQKITDNTVAIRNGMDSGRSNGPISSSGPAPVLSANDGNEVMKQLRRTHKKVETMEEALQNRLSVVANEVSDSSNNFVIEVIWKLFLGENRRGKIRDA